ncbi:MAG: hydroxyacid dehydrogenase [Sedimentisphaeraceae bacterium JB056]
MLKGIYILDNSAFDYIYGPEEQQDIRKYVDICAPQQTRHSILENLELLKDVDVIFSGWHMPVLTPEFLDSAPNLKAIFYGAGSVKGFVTDDLWERDIVLTSSYAANAVPVAEYTFAQIIFCLKRLWHYTRKIRKQRSYIPLKADLPGTYGTKVGIVSVGMIGQLVCKMLRNMSVDVLVYDPYATEELSIELNAQLCSLEYIFENCDVVSIHTPLLPETENFITGEYIRSMKKNSSLINTARGALIREDEMIEALKERQDITAVLDVLCPEPPEPSSPLYDMDNVVITPHIAGSTAYECRRLGRYMVDELVRFVENRPLQWTISQEKAAVLA